MTTLLVLRGLPGAGKSTWAQAWVARAPEQRVRVNRDDIRLELFGAYWHDEAEDPAVIKQKEQRVSDAERERIERALGAGKDVVSDNTNLNPRTFSLYGRLARRFGARLAHRDFVIPLEEALERNKTRAKPVAAADLERMAQSYLGANGQFLLFPGDYPVRPFAAPSERKQAIGFDLDGTLVDTRKIRHYVEGKKKNFDAFHRFSEFAPANEQVLAAMWQAHENGFAVLITTARQEAYNDVSQKWLDSQATPPIDNVYMRLPGDERTDYEVKKDMYERISEHYDLVHQFDDNPQAVKAWREKRVQVTIVPEFGAKGIDHEAVIPIQSPFGSGRCMRCGRSIAPGRLLGPDCAKIASHEISPVLAGRI